MLASLLPPGTLAEEPSTPSEPLDSGSSEALDASSELDSGSSELLDASSELDSGSFELLDAPSELDSGSSELPELSPPSEPDELSSEALDFFFFF